MNLAFCGLTGKMGEAFLKRLPFYSFATLEYGVARENRNVHGVPVFPPDYPNLPKVDVLVDFSRPQALMELLTHRSEVFQGLVSGTTGFSETEWAQVKTFAESHWVFYASNFSLGILAITRALKAMAPVLKTWDVSILDVHHQRKVDAPSGTAKMLAGCLQNAGWKTPAQMASSRLGDLAGQHHMTLGHGRETVTLSHIAEDPQVYVEGVFSVLDVAEKTGWIQHPGLYGMEDFFKKISENPH
jgi:4-hydroxy-tetrahydrodipicolinate reductase